MTFPVLALGVLGAAALAGLIARLTRQYFVVAVAAGAVILYLHGWLYFHYTSDDAYISYRYARNLSDGLGLVWNPGERVEGYSNFLWVAVLAGADRASLDIVVTGRWLGFALAVAGMALTYVLARDMTNGPAGGAAGLAACVLAGASPAFAIWTFAGLEVPLFAVLILGGVLLHLRESDGHGPPLSGAVWALASMTRPEGPLLFAISGAFKTGEGAASIRQVGTRRAWLREIGTLVLWAGGFAAIFVPYFAWRYTTYDYFFPNTYYAKVGTGIDQYDRGIAYLANFARDEAAWLVLLAPVAAAIASVRRLAVMYVFTLIIAWMAYVAYVGGDSLVRFRFFAPLVPLTWALVAASAAGLIGALRIPRATAAWARDGAIGAAVIGLAALVMHSSTDRFAFDLFDGEREAVEHRAEIGRWLRETLPDTTTIAVVPAGAIPYESRMTTIDMLGINDEHIAHRDLDIGGFSAGHEKYDTEYVLDRRPDIIILIDGLTETPRQRADYDGLVASVIPAVIDAVTNERLWREYELRAAEIREGAWFNLLARNDASDVLARTQAPPPQPQSAP